MLLTCASRVNLLQFDWSDARDATRSYARIEICSILASGRVALHNAYAFSCSQICVATQGLVLYCEAGLTGGQSRDAEFSRHLSIQPAYQLSPEKKLVVLLSYGLHASEVTCTI